MSRTPKRHQARFDEQRRAEQERQRREREERRRQEQARRREQSRLASVERATGRVAKVRARAHQLRDATSRHGLAAELERLVSDLQSLDQQARAATDAEAARRAGRAAGRLEQAVAKLAADVALREAASERKPRVAALLDLAQSEPAALRERFDSAGAAVVRQQLGALLPLLDTGRLKEFDAAFPRAQAAVTTHLETARAGNEEFQRRRDEALAALSELRHRWELMTSDARAVSVPLSDLAPLERRLAALEAEIAAEHLDGIAGASAELAGQLDRAERDIDDAIDRIVERREIFQRVLDTLPEVGYDVQRDTLQELADGTISVRASSMGGEQLAVVVQESAEGAAQVYYTSSSLQDEEEAGEPGAACGSLVTTIDELRDRLTRVGIQSGSITWDGRRPHERPPGRAAQALPRDTGMQGGAR